uniref:glycoside hydrolase domain-containing protein n=1 Tax=Mariniflexile sp. TaxID=1979402 RepID=UPI0040473905
NSSYEITSPLFDTIEIALNPNYYKGEKFTIKTYNNSAEHVYIKSAKLNGKKWIDFKFPHSIFANGGVLEIKLDDTPNKAWGIK